MRTAIGYYSMTGSCERVARAVASMMNADIIRLLPEKVYPDKGMKKFFWGGMSAVMGETPKLKPYDFRAYMYDKVILGFPVWASRPAPPIKTFLKAHAGELAGKEVGAYTCYLGGGADKALEALKKMAGRDRLDAQLILLDTEHMTKEVLKDKVKAFCRELEQS